MGKAPQKLIFLVLLTIALFMTGCGNKDEIIAVEAQEVEVSCGLCHFGLSAPQCDLAVRIKGKAYFVEGVDLGDHNKLHEPGGYCTMIRKARVSGQIQQQKFKALSYELLPMQ